MLSLSELRSEAAAVVRSDPSALVLELCWRCRPSQEYLRRQPGIVLSCPACHRCWYKGQDVSGQDATPPPAA